MFHIEHKLALSLQMMSHWGEYRNAIYLDQQLQIYIFRTQLRLLLSNETYLNSSALWVFGWQGCKVKWTTWSVWIMRQHGSPSDYMAMMERKYVLWDLGHDVNQMAQRCPCYSKEDLIHYVVRKQAAFPRACSPESIFIHEKACPAEGRRVGPVPIIS